MTILHNYLNSDKKTFSVLSIFIFLLILSSCSSNEEMPDERLVEKELYDQAQSRLKNGSFSTAIMSLEALEARFPFGRYAEQAQAELIYAYYMNSQFEASQSAAERFINLHPRHSHTGYAFYMKRGAYLAAIGRAKYVIEHLPNTPQTPYALSVLVEAYEMLEYEELRKTSLNILEANYPDFDYRSNESVKQRSWTNILTMGLVGKEDVKSPVAETP